MLGSILVLLFLVFYFIMEGVTEGMTWLSDGRDMEINSGTYHIYRSGELIGILGALLCASLFEVTAPIQLLVGALGIGLYVYERVFTHTVYDSLFHKRQWPYRLGELEIPYPPFEIQHILLGVSTFFASRAILYG